MKTQKVRILRCFYYQRKALQPGEIVDLPIVLVKESLAIKRVELCKEEEEKKPMPPPEITKEVEIPEPLEDAKIKKGGKRNAGESR